MEAKNRSKSKTVWFHVASACVAIAGVGLVYVNQLEINKEQAMYLSMAFVTVQTVGGIWLREVTNTPIK